RSHTLSLPTPSPTRRSSDLSCHPTHPSRPPGRHRPWPNRCLQVLAYSCTPGLVRPTVLPSDPIGVSGPVARDHDSKEKTCRSVEIGRAQVLTPVTFLARIPS